MSKLNYESVYESVYLTPAGIALLDRIYNRLSGCNAGAGLNYVDTPDLKAAFGIIEHIHFTYSRRPAVVKTCDHRGLCLCRR